MWLPPEASTSTRFGSIPAEAPRPSMCAPSLLYATSSGSPTSLSAQSDAVTVAAGRPAGWVEGGPPSRSTGAPPLPAGTDQRRHDRPGDDLRQHGGIVLFGSRPLRRRGRSDLRRRRELLPHAVAVRRPETTHRQPAVAALQTPTGATAAPSQERPRPPPRSRGPTAAPHSPHPSTQHPAAVPPRPQPRS